MRQHLKPLAVLAAGILIGSFLAAHNVIPTASAQTKSVKKSTAPKSNSTKKLSIPPIKTQSPIFPPSDDPEIARLYATAYIVGEALRAGVVETEKAGKLNPVDATKNLVRDVYKELGGK